MTPQELQKAVATPGRVIVSGAPEGLDGKIAGELARAAGNRLVLHVARDDQRAAMLGEAIAFFHPDVEVIQFPAWDCLPYDRVSPAAEILSRRLSALTRLANGDVKRPCVVLSTANAVLQRVPPREVIRGASFSAAPGNRINTEELQEYLVRNGFSRTGTVVDPGDYAIRGGIIDIFPPGMEEPVRLDFFGDTLESLRSFDPQSQRTTHQLKHLKLDAASEVLLTPETISQFRTGYTAAFSGSGLNDAVYEAVSAGRRYQGMEHWLALFYDKLETILDYAGDCVISLDHLADESMDARKTQIAEYYDARIEALQKDTFGAPVYKPLPPDRMYLTGDEWPDAIAHCPVIAMTPFEAPEGGGSRVLQAGGRQGRSFAAERAEAGRNVYEAVVDHVRAQQKAGRKVMLAAWTEGSRDRLQGILKDHDLGIVVVARNGPEALKRSRDMVSVAILALESGFETADLAVIAEQDILGDRLVRRSKRQRKASDFISELGSLTPGDLVVHVDHGIGRFVGLKVVEVQGAPHDCLHLEYHGGDRLFLPVENIELLSRYGSDDAGANLDKLGGVAWQARKARLKERVREIANQLIKTAAQRELREADVISLPDGLYDEFASRFPYEETEDQLNAIDAVMRDLARGRPMDRLICGDVGFGKTEVALRSAFVAVMAGKQVAVVVPTTLLARQHFATFSARFKGLPVRIEQASRLVGRKEINEAKAGLASGDVDIIIGTHALLANDVKFRDLGLLIIDEEQHFGVKHKEKLKELRANVHVLTLTATPIPRTLQLALSGVRELSLITTPPLDRLAVRTYISPFDPVIIRETLLRELYRGGQSFYVCPRVSDLDEVAAFLREQVPEVKVAVAHGRLAPTELDDIMTGFYDRKYDVLLATTIIESGLDIPTANTLIVHRADMFGLAQLYQIRGRVGRSKQRAYALFTVPANKPMTAPAEKRLKVLQSLDSLGAGFTLASHDLDIRGGGNLLGEEQSGHIREVGFELYQHMLEEAVASLRSGDLDVEADGQWSPQINVGTSVLLPEEFIPDLQVRLGVYRRLADLPTQDDLDGFAAELQDRFGRLPEEVTHLIDIVSIKLLCRTANVSNIDAGPKGAVFTFRDGKFPNPEALVQWINDQGSRAKIRPDMRLVIIRDWQTPADRLNGSRQLMQTLVKLADA
ncbi:MAG: transcription-repair coupling factor [Anderseniella sp.]|jgi:transcription-repair coupling factor (superfamily II helicase)|nr:transcription-repair coupling factor [Anderseniella sp.]